MFAVGQTEARNDRMQGPWQQADHNVGLRHQPYQQRLVFDVHANGLAAGMPCDDGLGFVDLLIGQDHLRPVFLEQVSNRRPRHQAGTQYQYLLHDWISFTVPVAPVDRPDE